MYGLLLFTHRYNEIESKILKNRINVHFDWRPYRTHVNFIIIIMSHIMTMRCDAIILCDLVMIICEDDRFHYGSYLIQIVSERERVGSYLSVLKRRA